MTEPRIIRPEEARALTHTSSPGPWRAHISTGSVSDEQGYAVAGECDSDEVVVLIAAAPDLAHTAAVLGEQREVVLALHRDEGGCCDSCVDRDGTHDRYPCDTARALGMTGDLAS